MSTYQRMTLEELYATAVDAAVQAEDADRIKSIKASVREHDRWVDVNHAAIGELRARGPEALHGFISLLEDPRPPVRLTAAGVVVSFDQDLAVPVLESLVHGKHGGISSSARTCLMYMRQQGIIPPE